VRFHGHVPIKRVSLTILQAIGRLSASNATAPTTELIRAVIRVLTIRPRSHAAAQDS
jgi:hypothetical protein